jgi:hypothetical protein
MTTIPYPSMNPPFGSKERLKGFFGDTLAECNEDYNPQDVADAFVEELESWIDYHKTCANAYELIRTALSKRVSTT